MIKGLIIEAEAPQDKAEGMTIIIMVMAWAIHIFPEGEVHPFKDGHGGRVVIIQMGRGYSPQAGTGDPEYRGIPQYRYICGICRNKGHYDHQCHTLQHLAHALQGQQAQGYNPVNNTPEFDNNNDQLAF